MNNPAASGRGCSFSRFVKEEELVEHVIEGLKKAGMKFYEYK
jgi:hypothetical protein